LSLVLLGLIGMNLSFYYSKKSWWKQVTPLRLSRSYSLKTLLILLWLFILLHLAFLYIPVIKQIPSIGQLLEPIGFIAYGMFYILWKKDKLSTAQKFIIGGIFIPMEIIPRLASGSLAQVMLLGLFIIIVSFFETKRLPLIAIVVTVSFLLILNPVKSEFRNLTWSKGGSAVTISSLEKVQIFMDLTQKRYFGSKSSHAKDSVNTSDSVINRTALIMVLSEVIKDTPRKVPYWQGETYLPLFTSFIPRAIFPDKPVENTGNVFGRRYNYLGSNDFTTSFNLPWIIELYANFGEIGVILGMSFIGSFLGFLEQKLNSPDMAPLEFITGSTILFSLIYQESNFSLMVGGILSLSLTLSILFRIFLGKKHQYTG
jgi:hypothetical protein